MRYMDYSNLVCVCYMTHDRTGLDHLREEADANGTLHWYTDIISDIEEMIVNYMKRYDDID